MNLHEELKKKREQSAEQMPEKVKQIVQRAIDDLEESGILDRVPGAGDPAPDFSLPGADGQIYHLAELREKGPVVAVFYRGGW